MLYIKHIDLTRLGTESGAADSQRARAWGTSGWFERDGGKEGRKHGRTDGRKEGRMDGRKAGRKVRMPATPRSRKFSWKSVETNEANIIATVWTFLARSGGAGEVVENLSHTGPQRVGG